MALSKSEPADSEPGNAVPREVTTTYAALPSASVWSSVRNWGALTIAIACVVWPAFGALHEDSFPLSNYPMFAAERGQPVMTQVVGFDRDGHVRRLNPELLGSSEVLQAKALVERAANGGTKSRTAFCEDVAQRVQHAQQATDDSAKIVRLELAKSRFDPVKYFTVAQEPIERAVVHSCAVNP
jgi:hypothetical protein